MTAFRHDVTGPAEATWLAQSWMGRLPLLGLPPLGTTVVVLSAHADDETLGAGGLIAAAAAAGLRVVLVVASDGAASHPNSTALVPAELVERRRQEIHAAAEVLCPEAQLVLLDLPDGCLGENESAIVDGLRAVLAPGPTWLLSTWSADGHPDHAACSRAAHIATRGRTDVRAFEFPVWWWHWQQPAGVADDLIATAVRLDLTPGERTAKRRAIGTFRSQIEPVGADPADQAVLSPDFLTHFDRDFEIFFDTGRHPASGGTYFRQLYQRDADPWQMAGRFYEQRKRAIVAACLPRERFQRAFEPGCGSGELSEILVDRCAELICCDASPRAVEATATRLRKHGNARVVTAVVPAEWPAGRFDLVVLSEVGYFSPDLAELADRIDGSLTDDGVVVLVHWRWPAADHPYTAETVHATIRSRCRLTVIAAYEEADFLMHVLSRDVRSVATRESIVG